MSDTIRIGTRKSRLALWQANHVADLLRAAHPQTNVELVHFTTKGDKVLDKSLPSIGGKGLFTAELEAALLSGEIDCAVHSLKDLPTVNPDGLMIGAVPQRAPVEDALVSKHRLALADLPEGATVGTSSLRRAAQLRHQRPDIQIADIRGNVPTRIEKALDPDGVYDAIVLARAGIERLGLTEHITQIIPRDVMLPAPGQGAIGVQCRKDDDSRHLFRPIEHSVTRIAVEAERAFLNKLEGGCSVPIGAYAYAHGGTWYIHGRVSSVDGREVIDIERSCGDCIVPLIVGRALAKEAIQRGARDILTGIQT